MGKQFANLHQPYHPDCFIYYLKKKRKFNALRRIQGQKFRVQFSSRMTTPSPGYGQERPRRKPRGSLQNLGRQG
jgi:hypothetical protein